MAISVACSTGMTILITGSRSFILTVRALFHVLNKALASSNCGFHSDSAMAVAMAMDVAHLISVMLI